MSYWSPKHPVRIQEARWLEGETVDIMVLKKHLGDVDDRITRLANVIIDLALGVGTNDPIAQELNREKNGRLLKAAVIP
jgi:hypothetical protein